MLRTGNCLRGILVALAAVGASGCEATLIDSHARPKLLTAGEMDQLTAGSAAAVNRGLARAVGDVADTNVTGSALAHSANTYGLSGSVPPFDFATSKIAAAASAASAQARVSAQVTIAALSRKTELDGSASSSGTGQAIATAQLYGVGTRSADVVFGTVTAAGCCGADVKADAGTSSGSTASYSRELAIAVRSAASGTSSSRVDAALVSSMLPILPPARQMVAVVPTKISPKY